MFITLIRFTEPCFYGTGVHHIKMLLKWDSTDYYLVHIHALMSLFSVKILPIHYIR